MTKLSSCALAIAMLSSTLVVTGFSPVLADPVSDTQSNILPQSQDEGSPIPSASETRASKDAISGKVSELMNEKFVATPSATPIAASSVRSTRLDPSYDMPRSVAQAEDQVTIQNNVAKMFGEKLTSQTPRVAPPVQNSVAPPPIQPVAAPPFVATSPTPPPVINRDTENKSTEISSVAPVAAATAALTTTAATSTVAATNVAQPTLGFTAAQADITPPSPTLSLPPPPTSPAPAVQHSALSVNSESASSPETPKLVPPVNSTAISTEAVKTDLWNSSDSAITAPSVAAQIEADQKNALAGPAIAKQAAAAATIKDKSVMAEAAGNASDVPDAAFIKNLAGTDGIISLDVASIESPIHADRTVGISKPVHIDEAVAFALKNNFEVQASDEQVNSAHWDKIGAYAQYGPSAEYDFDSGSERSQPGAFNDSNGNRVLDNTHHRRDTNVSVRQPLIDLSVIADILSAGDKEDAIKADRRDVREGIASDTINVFLRLLQARIAVRLADEYKAYLDNLAARMTARVEGGGATNADLDRIHGRSELAYSARIEALGEYQTDLAEFKRLTKVMPSQIKIPDLLAPAVPENMGQALDRAVHANPAYMSSLSKIDAAADDRNKAFSGLLPKMSIQYNKSFNYDAGGSAEGNPIDGVYPEQKEETVLLVAQWVLGGTSITTGLSGAAKEREMRLRSQDVLDRMEQAMQSSYTAINAARQRRGVLQKTVAANERVVKGFEDQYKDGNRSLFDLLDSYEQLYSARLNLMRVVIANAQASYQIRREMGELVPSILGAEAQ